MDLCKDVQSLIDFGRLSFHQAIQTEMNREEFFYLLPYLFSLALSLGILFYSWRHRHVRGAGAYTWFVAGQTVSILAFILELVSPSLDTKILWDKFQWLTETLWIIVAFLIFALQFTEYKFRYPITSWSILLIAPVIFTFLLITDNVHHLIYPNPQLNSAQPFPEMEYDLTYVVYLYAFYIYISTLYGIGLLIRRIFQPHNLYRSQLATIAAGFLIPVILSILSLSGIKVSAQRDIFPFSIAMGNLIVAVGLFRYRLFEIVPIARERVIENMTDPVIVLDALDRVVDINQAALNNIGKKGSGVIGQPSNVVFAEWSELVEEFRDVDQERRGIAIKVKFRGQTLYYELSISPIRDRANRLVGRIFVAHDITKRKILEDGYRQLSEELEQRVRDRTEELRKSAERYRAVVENQTEFIVRWKPDGTRTFVNEAYCRYFSLTSEEALSTSFIPLVAQEDQRAVEEKFSRLKSGMANSETEIHRVVRPDGSIGWQEWTDHAIRNATGQIVEFQSVGRDITERKQSEEIILNQLAFDALITRLLTRLSSTSGSGINAAIELGLEEIARFIGADHAYVIIIAPDQSSWSISHEWFTPPASSFKEFNQNVSKGLLKWSEDKILAGEEVRINTLDQLPPEALRVREFREAEGAISILNVPISGPTSIITGCVGLDCHARPINWSDRDVTRLKIVGDAIANILERKRAEENLAEAYDTTLEGWAKALELRDKETEGHSRRVTETTLTVARAAGFNEEELLRIRRGSTLHDIGKMGIPDDILRKNGPLTEEEREVVKNHPNTAFELLKRIPYLEKSLEIPYCHHEKWDGSGYPRGLKGEEIPLSARIFAVVDVWDALSSDRPYREAWSREKVAAYLLNESGKHFDPKVLDIFLELMRQGKI